MYWWNLYKDISILLKFAKASKSQRDALEQDGLRVDGWGRIYTVINVPEEVQQQQNEYTLEAWVLQQLRPYTQSLLKIGLADYAVPTVERIKEPNTFAYLVVMYPEAETLHFGRFILNVLIWAVVALGLKVAYNLIAKSGIIEKAVELISQYV